MCFWVVLFCGSSLCVGGHRNRVNPAEACVCMNSPSADSSTCQRLNVSWHLHLPYVPALRHVVWGEQVHVRVCTLFAFYRWGSLNNSGGCLLSVQAGLVHPVGRCSWRCLSHQVSASCHAAGSCLSKCVCGASEGWGWRENTDSPRHQTGRGKASSDWHFCSFISSFAGICGNVSGRSAAHHNTSQISNICNNVFQNLHFD